MTVEPLRLTIFASGHGSNFRAILDNIEKGNLAAKIVLVLSNRSSAGALSTARERGIPALHLSQKQYESEGEYIKQLLKALEDHQTQIIILAGYLKKIPAAVIKHYKNRILNIHPALLPSFGGEGLYGHHVHQAVLDYGCKVSGATVHLVDEEYDTGPPIVQRCVPVLEGDTAETLSQRVLKIEHQIFPEAIKLFAENRIRIEERKVKIV